MCRTIRKILCAIVFLTLISQIKGVAQIDPTSFRSGNYSGYNIVSSDALSLSEIVLPPIEVLYANAESNPKVMRFDKQKEYEELLLRYEKRHWLSFINLVGNAQYGDTYSQTFDQSGNPVTNPSWDQPRFNYTIGGGLYIPLDRLFNMGNRIRRQQARVSEREYERLGILNEIKESIAELYAKITQLMPLLNNSIEQMVFYNSQYIIFENDYINGLISSSELALEKSRLIGANNTYEMHKADLYAALLRLEIISNTLIISGNRQDTSK